MKNKLKTKKSLKYKKNNRKSRKILLGGDKTINVADYISFLDKRIKETYSFLPCAHGECNITKQPTEKYEFDINPDYTTKSNSINYTYNYEENLQKYELYYPDYHGAHETITIEKTPPNCYLCIFGFFDTNSWVIKKNLIDFAKFFKNMSKQEFDIICKYKSLLSSPELKHKVYMNYLKYTKGTPKMDCFLKGSWIFPNQSYYDINFTISNNGQLYGEKEIKLVNTYYNKYENSKFKTDTIPNTTTITSIASFIRQKADDPDKKYIIFVDACRPNMIIKRAKDMHDILKTENLITNINEIFYRNQSLNYAIYKSKYPSFGIGSEDYKNIIKLKHGLCSSDMGNYKSIFISAEQNVLSHRNIPFYKPEKNDNLHPLIPKLRYLYDILLTIAPGDIESYFKNNFDNLSFIIGLSFNKLRKFLVKLKTKSPVICDTVIQCIKNNKKCMKIWTYYNTSYKNMLDKYNAWSDSYANVYHNFKICSFIFDFLELSYLFNNSNIHSRQITQIQKTPFSTLFSLEDYIIEPTNVNYRSKIIKINGYIFNPFILPIHNKKIFRNVTVFEAVNCKNFENKFTFDFISFNKLQSLNIDDTAFTFRGVGPIKDLNYILTKCFHQNMEDINAKEIKINNFMLPPVESQTGEIINFINFKIISLKFRENDTTYNILPEIHIKNSKEIELIKFGNCNLSKKINIEDVDKVQCLSIQDNTIVNDEILINNTSLIGLELFNIIKTENILYKRGENLKYLKVLKLYNLGDITNTQSVTIKFEKLEILEIKDCTLKEISFNIRKIKELTLIDTIFKEYSNNNTDDMLLDCIDNLKINIDKCTTIPFNIYIKDTIKNSNINIVSSKFLFNNPEQIKKGKIKYYKLSPDIKLSRNLSKYMEKRKNKIHILGVDL